MSEHNYLFYTVIYFVHNCPTPRQLDLLIDQHGSEEVKDQKNTNKPTIRLQQSELLTVATGSLKYNTNIKLLHWPVSCEHGC